MDNSNKRQKLMNTNDIASVPNDENNCHRGSSIGMAEILRNNDLMAMKILPSFDVVSLVGKKRVCKDWNEHCIHAIDAKVTTTTPKSFDDGEELKRAADKYVKGDRHDLEDVTVEYGYPIGKWDVSNVRDFFNLFEDCHDFNEDIGSWNTSNAISMRQMFFSAKSFNRDISQWDVSKVTGMCSMFAFASSFNQELAMWDVSKVTGMTSMFFCASSFNQDLSEWNVSRVKDMSSMFMKAAAFNCDLSRWGISNETKVHRMFLGATSFNRDVVSHWDDILPVQNRRNLFGFEDSASSFFGLNPAMCFPSFE